MPQIGPISIRLTQEDHDRLQQFLAKDGRKQNDLVRDALLEYIDPNKKARAADREVVEALKSIENRFAVLLVRLGVDLNSMYALAWALTDEQPDREELFEKCYETGITRFRRKLRGLEKDMVDSLLKEPGEKKTKGKKAEPDED